jgi:nitrate/nitrite transport system substrate-binding protein
VNPGTSRPCFKGIGVPVITDYEIWKDNPEKVFGMTKEFTEEIPKYNGSGLLRQ